MKIAILSDIHANWQALEAVMRDCPQVDETLCLGDVVGYGGDPKKCVDEVNDQGWLTLVGNHDRACTDPEILDLTICVGNWLAFGRLTMVLDLDEACAVRPRASV